MKFFKKLCASFAYAGKGIAYAVMHERNFRIHLIAIAYTLTFAFVYGLDGSEFAVLVLTFALVPSFELINTAIECAVDAATTEFNKFSKTAKDTAAGAVLVSAIAAIGVAVSLFSDIEKLSAAFGKVFSAPGIYIFVVSLIPAIAFVVFCHVKED